MRGGRHAPWTDAERQMLHDQRASGTSFAQLSVPGRTQKACVQAYYRSRKPESRPTSAPGRRALADVPALAAAPAVAAELAKPVHRPRYVHDADLDLRARIAAQGLTAGWFGDPRPGRSALDQREARK